MQGAEKEWGITSLQMGILGTSISIGLMCGASIFTYTADKFGRSATFKITGVISLISGIILVFSINFEMLVTCLLLLGAGIGGDNCLAGPIFCENCPPSKRNYLALMGVFWGIGTSLASLIAFIIVLVNKTQIYDWRIIAFSASCIQFFSCFSRFGIRETPEFLYSQNKLKEMENVINQISLANTKKEFKFDYSLWEIKENPTQILEIKTQDKFLLGMLFKGRLFRPTIVFAIVFFI